MNWEEKKKGKKREKRVKNNKIKIIIKKAWAHVVEQSIVHPK